MEISKNLLAEILQRLNIVVLMVMGGQNEVTDKAEGVYKEMFDNIFDRP